MNRHRDSERGSQSGLPDADEILSRPSSGEGESGADDAAGEPEELIQVDFAEAVGSTLEEAIFGALDVLGADEDEVEIEVLEQGKRAFLGLGRGRPYRVRVSWREDLDEEVIEEEIGEDEDDEEDEEAWSIGDDLPIQVPTPDADWARQVAAASEPARDTLELAQQEGLAPSREGTVTPPLGAGSSVESPGGKGFGRRPSPGLGRPPSANASPGSGEEVLERASQTTRALLAEMGFEATVRADWQESELLIDVECAEGDDAVLIGRRGETRAALQHIVQRLIHSSREEAAPLLLDVNGYWGRRAERLVEEARALAQRALELGREFQTEPLSPQERRIIHRALLEDGRVSTESIGSGLLKKVAIIPNPASRD